MDFVPIVVGVVMAAGIAAWLIYLVRKARQKPQTPETLRVAATLIWHELWGLSMDLLPILEVVTGAELNCGDSARGWMDPIHGRCVAGLTWMIGPVSARCQVACPVGIPLSQTALVHELRHARDILDGRGGLPEDEQHNAPTFYPDIEAGNAYLIARGF